MHIQDGILSPEVCTVTGALSLGAVGFSIHKLKHSLADSTVPLTGMMSALIFAAQMVNFPLIGTPVSGHLMGGVLAAVVLGPWAGCLAVTLVLLVQWAVFSDGGMLALGANVLHMAVVGSIGGYAVYATIRRWLGRGFGATVVGAVVASWLSVLAAAALFCLEFRLSWPSTEFQFANIFTLMVTVHSLIGVGEALITGSVVSFVLRHRTDLIATPQDAGSIAHLGRVTTFGTVCALAVAAFLSPFASEYPDGLEAVAEQIGFASLESPHPLLLDDYHVPLPFNSINALSVSAAGIGGCLAILLIATVLGRALHIRTPAAEGGRE